MNSTDFKAHSLTHNEKLYGTVWLIFQTLLFATLLQTVNLLLSSPLSQPVVNFLYFAVNFSVVTVVFRNYLHQQGQIVREAMGRILFITVTGFAAYWVLNVLLTLILFAIDPSFTSINDVTIGQLVQQDFLLMFLGTVILVPITEETLFRGLVFRGLYDKSPVLAWILSVVLFSLVHILGYISAYPFHTLLLCFVQYLPAGILLAAAYRLSGSLLTPILIHALVNFFGMMALR